MIPDPQRFEWISGTGFDLYLKLTDGDTEQPYTDLAICQITYVLADRYGTEVLRKTEVDDISVDDPDVGTVRIPHVEADTTGLDGPYSWELEVRPVVGGPFSPLLGSAEFRKGLIR